MSVPLFRSIKAITRHQSYLAPSGFVRRLPKITRCFSSDNSAPGVFPEPQEIKVLLDHQTLYINQELAEALGWHRSQGTEPVKLSLNGWEPMYFTITPTGTDSERLARSTVESSQNKNVQEVLKRLE
ncbi:hypothetical protein BDN70DRAFT_867012 [Pholiota conissans]|uniref:Uncharacterized protein n=1 Tax=Pholiota conissans TaxID=109636 RepID=A0A9P6CUF4_9AGAR|nr:hypothetical protein BDN70DRAFT_867012 [Pholiota conissans]